MKTVKPFELQKPVKVKFNVEDLATWIMGLIGLVSGCMAYVNGIPFLDFSWSGLADNIIGLLWAGFVAVFTTALGMLTKHIYDVKMKSRIDKWLKRKKRRRP